MAKFTINIPLSADQKARVEKMKIMASQLEVEKASFIKDARGTEGVSGAVHLVGGNPNLVSLTLNDSFLLNASFDLIEDPSGMFKAVARPQFVDSTVINQILNSKLLTDDEKRYVMKKQFPFLFEDKDAKNV